MSTTESQSILKAIKRTDSDALPPLCEWSSTQRQAFHRNFVAGNPVDLPLSENPSANFKISPSAFEMSKYPDQASEPYDHVTQALCSALRAFSGGDIRTDQFPSHKSLNLVFEKTVWPVPGAVVISTRGVPVVGYNTSAFIDDRSQMHKVPKHRKPYT